VADHHYAPRSFDGTAMTVGEMAVHLIDKAVTDLRTMEAWKDKTEDEIVRTDLLSRFMHNLGNAPRLGVTIPVRGPAMTLRIEYFGSYSMNGMFWLSGFRKGIFTSKEEMGCGEETLDRLHERVREELDRLPEGDRPSMPSYEQLGMRTGPGSKPNGWYDATLRGPDGSIFEVPQIIWPHADSSAIAIAVEKIMLTACCLYVHAEKFARSLETVRGEVTDILGDIPLESITITDYQGGGGAALWDSRVVTYRIRFPAKDEFLGAHRITSDIMVTIGGGDDPYESLRKVVEVQKRRLPRHVVTVSRPAAVLSAHKGDRDVLLQHFTNRREHHSHDHSYFLKDGLIDMNAVLDREGAIKYEAGVIRLKGHDIPETMLRSIKGRPARDVVDHPALEDCIIKRAARLKDHLAIYLDAPFITQEQFEKLSSGQDT
jgi:hypothetical protein